MWAGISGIVLVLFFTFGLPAILRAVLESQITKNLNRPATVEAVRFNPFTLCLSVQGLSIREPDGTEVFVSFDRLLVNAEIVSVFKRALVLRQVTLTKPHVRLVRTEANTYNFSDMLAPPGSRPEGLDDPPPSKPFRFSVANIQLINGFVEFNDQPRNTVHVISGIEIGLPLISNFKRYADVFVDPSFSAIIDGHPFSLQAQTKPFADSLETELDLDLPELELAQYLPYIPAKLNFSMPSGRLNMQMKLRYVQRPDSIDKIRFEGGLALADIVLVNRDDSPLLGIPSLAVSGIVCMIDSRELVIDDLSLRGLNLAFAREKDGVLSLQKLFEAEAAADVHDIEQTEDAPEEPWSVTVKKFTSEDAALSFDDLLPRQPARFTIDDFNIALTNITMAGEVPADIDLSCRINDDAGLAIKGTFALEPLAAELALDLSALDIRCAQSYLPDNVLVSINSGMLDLQGDIDFSRQEEADPSVMWQGDVRLSDLAAGRSGAKDDFVKFSTLDLKSMRAGTVPQMLDIDTISLADLVLRTVVEPDGTFNLTSLVASPAEVHDASETSSANGEPPQISIGGLELSRGRVLFSDSSVTPRYSAELADITGRISGISNRPAAQADIRLNASLNRHAPLAIGGTLQPLQEKLTADLIITFDNIELNQFSPYSGRYIGRVVEKGKLSLDLKYLVEENRLTSQNKFFIDQLTLGTKVKSPDATSLPVGLAISLLKNRNGEIHLDLPVFGNLDDPEFRVGKVILKTLVNLLEKAATSPFSLVGSLLPGGGGDVSTIAFACGSAELEEEARHKLDILAGLLIEKPDLRLEIRARGDRQSDTEGLRREWMLARMQRQKFRDMSRREREGLLVEQVVISAGEFEEYLWQAYKDEDFEKPEGLFGITKRIPADEMEQLMLANMNVEDDDVSELVQQRGLAAKDYLAGEGGVPPGRMFITGVRVRSSGTPEDCAVEFTLK
jgi:uncharacterized protein involved in outer membrane biogenesis